MKFASLLLMLCTLAAVPAHADLLDDLALPGAASAPRQFLPPDQAFQMAWEQPTPDSLSVTFDIAEGYYLYRDKFAVKPVAGVTSVGSIDFPPSETKDDPEFGEVQIYRGAVALTVPLEVAPRAEPARLQLVWQGCAEDGICYPPIKREITLTPPAKASPTPGDAGLADPVTTPAPAAGVSIPPADAMDETSALAARLDTQSLPLTALWFLMAGLALALTPCVFPMVPILAGIIVGDRARAQPARGLWLATVYVLAMASTYAVVGLLAGLFGRNLQAGFQHPAVLTGFSALFVVLALSMFGFFHLQVPAFIQNRVEAASRRQQGGRLLGVAVMGVLSAVIVGPCVAPPLAAALIYLGRSGSPVTGGVALFALGLGMGAPLLVLGASAGRWLPRAGVWMESVKHAFGVIFLGLAIWFLERVVPPATTLALWGVLLIGAAIYLGAVEPLRETASGWQRFFKGIGLSLLCYGVVLLVGAAAGANDPLRPLAPLTATRMAVAGPADVGFQAVRGPEGLAAALSAAAAAGQPALLDVYADWCIECKRLERNTFAAPEVQAALAGTRLLRADVTASDATDGALLKSLGLVGPPAVLLFSPDGRERSGARLVGYEDPAQFLSRLRAAQTP
jgi:thiol:disulfide interchange protein DsbD